MTAPDRYFETGPKIRRGRGKSRASLRLIDAAYQFLAEANPTTVRGVAYHLFTKNIIKSMSKNETARVSRLMTDAREAGLVPWEWIVDETRALERTPSWSNPEEYLAAVRRSYRRDFWVLQPHDVEVWSEKGTVRGVLAPVLDEYGVGFRVMHGFSGATTVNDVATSGDGRQLVALYVGDWDPSGLYMSEKDLPTRLARYGGEHVEIWRVALEQGDVDDPGLPSFPTETKIRDPRYRWFVEEFGSSCWELDAMHPNTLRERVRERIELLIERESWNRCAAAQQAEQASLQSVLDTWHGRPP